MFVEESGVEEGFVGGGDFDAGGVGVEWVEEVVEGLRQDGRGDAGEDGAAGF